MDEDPGPDLPGSSQVLPPKLRRSHGFDQQFKVIPFDLAVRPSTDHRSVLHAVKHDGLRVDVPIALKGPLGKVIKHVAQAPRDPTLCVAV